ncbi:MAG: hypothetical protein H7838_06855 [Magnetococcus sp. DMHC-8]
MTDDQSEPLQRLLQRLALHQQQACRQILEEARAQAVELIATAEAEARRRLGAAREAEEARLAEAQATLQARQATASRQNRLRQTQTLLERGWTRLLESVAQRWANGEQRALWLHRLLRQARQTLPGDDWTVHHPPDWEPTEWPAGLPVSRWQADPELTAGLRIGCRGAWLDGSLQGMMANRRELSALLLAQLEKDEEHP